MLISCIEIVKQQLNLKLNTIAKIEHKKNYESKLH